MLRIWDTFMTSHQSEEDTVFFPWFVEHGGNQAADIVSTLEADHATYKRDEDAIIHLTSVIREQLSLPSPDTVILLRTLSSLHTSLNDLATKYTSHALKEEELIVPLLATISESEIQQMADILKKRGKESPQASFALLLFRDACASEPEVWAQTLPWFVRSLVIPMLSLFNSDYAKYLQLTA
jgi:iron-sulfur cluster repair protein YtfE (RIC family)